MIRLAILWHMHQPFYQHPGTREHALPWARLHALKDYRGMADVLEPFPRVRVTINLVPSLLAQVQAYATGDGTDRLLQVGLTPADALTDDDRAFLVANGFHAQHQRMIAPYPRYTELHDSREQAAGWGVDELRDLQVWHKLAWMDPDLLQQDARLVRLVGKGRGYSEEDKTELRAVELEWLRTTVEAYRRAQARRQVELSTSPFYHPILPLLCDTDAHLAAHPEATRPVRPFRRPEDAREQLARAVRYHRELFGEAWSAIQLTTASALCAVLDLHVQGGLAQHGFVRQEDIDFGRFMQNRFGRHYECTAATRYSAI